jgi:hypothetical protein
MTLEFHLYKPSKLGGYYHQSYWLQITVDILCILNHLVIINDLILQVSLVALGIIMIVSSKLTIKVIGYSS